jgi:hypothetical protein
LLQLNHNRPSVQLISAGAGADALLITLNKVLKAERSRQDEGGRAQNSEVRGKQPHLRKLIFGETHAQAFKSLSACYQCCYITMIA